MKENKRRPTRRRFARRRIAQGHTVQRPAAHGPAIPRRVGLVLALALAGAALALAPRALSAGAALAPRAGHTAIARVNGAPAAPASKAAVAHANAAPVGIVRVAAGAGVIVENGQAPLSPLAYTIVNHWCEVKGGATVIVYAGAERGDPTRGVPAQGVVVVERAAAGYTSVAGPYVYRAPVRAGALRVVGAGG